MRNATPAPRTRPTDITYRGLLVVDWRCPSCHKPNTSHRDAETRRLDVKCGHCHLVTHLDYNQLKDAPFGVLDYVRSLSHAPEAMHSPRGRHQ